MALRRVRRQNRGEGKNWAKSAPPLFNLGSSAAINFESEGIFLISHLKKREVILNNTIKIDIKPFGKLYLGSLLARV